MLGCYKDDFEPFFFIFILLDDDDFTHSAHHINAFKRRAHIYF